MKSNEEVLLKITLNKLIITTVPVIAAGLLYTAYNEIKNSQSISDIKKEMVRKDSLRYNSLINSLSSRNFYSIPQQETKIAQDSLKIESTVNKAQYEGSQLIKNSLKTQNY